MPCFSRVPTVCFRLRKVNHPTDPSYSTCHSKQSCSCTISISTTFSMQALNFFFQTGAIYSPELLASFANLAQERGIALVVDETYRDLITSGPPHRLFSPASSTNPGWEWRSNFIHLFSFSKSYCVPGHRLGAIIASPLFLDEVNTVLDCMQVFGTFAHIVWRSLT